MHRMAEKAAAHEKAMGIASGENIGQVASQTLANHQTDKLCKSPSLQAAYSPRQRRHNKNRKKDQNI